ncbi:hypothetical protein [Streptomyces sp. NPDC047108]|uniref:hypothetical protein n=1 Tax=Streptomyces sp. NPDC047108 TaxID=3155025 RepID=UPI0033ED76D4
MGSDPRTRLTRPFRLPRRAAVIVAAAALCSAVALPAYAVDTDPLDETPAGSSAGTTADDPLSDLESDPLSDPLTDSLSDEFGESDEADDGTSSSSAPSSSENLKITPSVVAPGAEVEIRVQGLKETKGTKVVVRSEVFVTEARLASDSRGGLYGEAKIKSSASPGRHSVTCDCGVKATITIVATHDSSSPHESPTAPVRAGGGGTAVLAPAAAEKEDGPGLAHFVVAAGLAGGAALAFAGIAVRRRRADTAGD